jgi:hypothetical protein
MVAAQSCCTSIPPEMLKKYPQRIQPDAGADASVKRRHVGMRGVDMPADGRGPFEGALVT